MVRSAQGFAPLPPATPISARRSPCSVDPLRGFSSLRQSGHYLPLSLTLLLPTLKFMPGGGEGIGSLRSGLRPVACGNAHLRKARALLRRPPPGVLIPSLWPTHHLWPTGHPINWSTFLKVSWRRGRDSNPRNLAVHLISNQTQSTTLPPLLTRTF